MQRGLWVLIGLACVASPTSIVASQSVDSLTFVTWNVTWLGHAAHAPVDDDRQIREVASVLSRLSPTVAALQEVSSHSALSRVLDEMDRSYAGLLARRGGDQRLAVVYRRDLVSVIDATDEPLSSAAYDFAGRPPFFVHIRPVHHAAWTELLLAIVHLKAFGDAQSYERRLSSLTALKAHLDQVSVPRIVAGDFNDGLFESIAPARESPLTGFRLDTLQWSIPTGTLTAFTYCATADCSHGSAIDHFILDRQLDAWSPAVRVPTDLLFEVNDYVATTSDHLPLQLTLVPAAPATMPGVDVAIYPNPFVEWLTIRSAPDAWVERIEMHDLLGRRVLSESVTKSHNHRLIVPGPLPSGAYILRLSGRMRTVDRIVFRQSPAAGR